MHARLLPRVVEQHADTKGIEAEMSTVLAMLYQA